MLLENIVVGSSVEAAYYALVNEYYFLSNRTCPAMFYNLISSPDYGIIPEPELWTSLGLSLGLSSKRMTLGKDNRVKVMGDCLVVIKGTQTFRYEFSKMHVFDPTGIDLENNILKGREKTYVVLDDFELSVLGERRQELPSITGGTGFARELHFYSSDRVDGATYITDCVVESELTQQQLYSFDYSDSMARFVVERHLSSVGVEGRFMEFYKNGKPKYRKPKVLHVKRLVFEKDNNTYEDSKYVRFLKMSMEDIIEKSTKR